MQDSNVTTVQSDKTQDLKNIIVKEWMEHTKTAKMYTNMSGVPFFSLFYNN